MSNYTISLSNTYVDRYSPVRATGPEGRFNDAPARYLSDTVTDQKGRINDSGIQYLMELQEKAKGLADRLNDPTNFSAMQTMVAVMPEPVGAVDAEEPLEPVAPTGENAAHPGVISLDQRTEDSDWMAPYRESLASYQAGETPRLSLHGPDTAISADAGSFSAEDVQKLTDGFNTMMEVARRGEELGNDRLRAAMEAAVDAYQPQLSEMGVTMGKDGDLSLDRVKLANATENDFDAGGTSSYQSTFQGLRDRLNTVAQSVVANPAYYVGPNSSNGLNPNGDLEESTSATSPFYLQSRNQQWYQLGFLIDLFV